MMSGSKRNSSKDFSQSMMKRKKEETMEQQIQEQRESTSINDSNSGENSKNFNEQQRQNFIQVEKRKGDNNKGNKNDSANIVVVVIDGDNKNNQDDGIEWRRSWNLSNFDDILSPQTPHTLKEWHRSVSNEMRLQQIHRFVRAIFPSPDPTAIRDQRIRDLITYARKVERERFEQASDVQEYLDLLSAKLEAIQRALIEKKKQRLYTTLQNDRDSPTPPQSLQEKPARLEELCRRAVKSAFPVADLVWDEEEKRFCCRRCIESLQLPELLIEQLLLKGTRPLLQQKEEVRDDERHNYYENNAMNVLLRNQKTLTLGSLLLKF